MFDLLLVKPIFNLLVLIYGLLPGHNFGVTIIIFTVVVRLLMWPLVKKQLHHTKAIRELQPELKRIKQAAKGNRQQEQLMMMQLYKERGVSPFGSLGVLAVQVIVLLALYSGLNRLVKDPQTIFEFSYGWVESLSYLQELAGNIGQFARDNTFLGIDLSRAAHAEGVVYWPAMILVMASALSQYFISKQLLPEDKESRGLRQILRDAGEGKKADTAETNAAVGRSMLYIFPFLIFFLTKGLPAVLSLYWLVSGIVAYFQQAAVLNQDKGELQAVADKPGSKTVIEGEVVATKPKTAKRKKASPKAKRRKK